MEGEELTLDKVKQWRVVELKDFLRKRGLSVTGNKEVLARRSSVLRMGVEHSTGIHGSRDHGAKVEHTRER